MADRPQPSLDHDAQLDAYGGGHQPDQGIPEVGCKFLATRLAAGRNVTQLLSLILTLLGFAGGLFIPISQLPGGVQAVAKWTPEYGLNQLVHAPLLGAGVDWTWAVNAVAWLAIFVGAAIWRFRKDTARV
jgi:ABC-type polysaccharide/polyol phosphate export permease